MDYEIIRTKRKTVAISVSREQKITIRTPLRFTEREAQRIINENSDWIKKQLHIMKERSENSIYSRLSECDIQFLKEKAKKVFQLAIKFQIQKYCNMRVFRYLVFILTL